MKFLASIIAILATSNALLGADVPIPVSIPFNGRASVAIYNKDGQLVRTLLTGKPLTKGDHAFEWDGLDRYGHSLPKGEYEWKLLATQGLRAEYITQIGQNVNPVWERATGNHTAPNAVAVDSTGLYRLGAENEGAHWGVKTDLSGRHVWTNDRWSADPWVQKSVAIALVNDKLFELLPNGHVYGYDKHTGRVFTKGDFDPQPWNLRWDRFEPPQDVKEEDRRRLNAAESPRDLSGDQKNNLLVAAYPQHNAIVWFDATNGEQIDVANDLIELSGIAVSNDGSVLAISQGGVLKLSRENKKPSIVIPADQLQSPFRIAVSVTSGDIFVAENSETNQNAKKHHQVKRFSGTGELLHAFGKPDGRDDGKYIATDFRGITDIEADSLGGFVVTEGKHTPPRRSAQFTADGQLVREWYGAQHYGVIACPEPNNPRYVWTRANADIPGLLRWEVDYQTKTNKLVETYQETFYTNRFLENNSAHGSAVPTLFEHQGKIYIYNGGMGSLTLFQYDPKKPHVRPCNVSTGSDGKAIIWNDLNDDGQVTDDEIHSTTRNVVGGYIDPHTLSIRTTPYATRYQPGHLLTPIKLTSAGTPVYDWSKAASTSPWQENGQTYHPLDYRKADDGGLFGSISDSARNPNEGVETHGSWYYNSCSAIDRLVKWNAEGKQLWSVGRHSPDDDHETGSTAMPRGLVGFTHGCIIWADASDEETARPTVWTQDGLYVDELLRVPLDSFPKEAFGMFNANEFPTGHLAEDPETGETYYYAINSGGGTPIYRITGWENWHHASGTIQLDAHQRNVATRNGSGLKAEYFNNNDCSGEPAMTRIDPLVYFNWGKESPDKLITNESFSVRWSGTYEALTNNEVRFQIRGSFPWRDKGQPTWARLWLGDELVCNTAPNLDRGSSTFDDVSRGNLDTVRVSLRAGERVAIKLECGFRKGEAAVALSHDTSELDRRAILPEFLYPEPGPTKSIEHVTQIRPERIAAFNFDLPDGNLFWSETNSGVFGRLTGLHRIVPGKNGLAIELDSHGEFEPASFPIDEELQLPDRNYSVSFHLADVHFNRNRYRLLRWRKLRLGFCSRVSCEVVRLVGFQFL